MKMLLILTLLAAAILLPGLAQAADFSPVPSIHVGYLWTRDSGGPAVALPWTLGELKLTYLNAALTIDVLFGGVTEVVSGSVPAAAGAGITLSDPAKRVHAAACITTAGKVAGFLGVQVFGLPGAASLVGNRLVPTDGLAVGLGSGGPQVVWSKSF